jgi:hypothetical protein
MNMLINSSRFVENSILYEVYLNDYTKLNRKKAQKFALRIYDINRFLVYDARNLLSDKKCIMEMSNETKKDLQNIINKGGF